MRESRFNGPLARWVRALFRTRRPDPWPAEVDIGVRSSNSVPLCISCLLPQSPHRWFCPRCGCPTGDFVPIMPYLQIFVVAEVLRRGVSGAPERRIGVQLFLAVVAVTQYAMFAPVYWYWMLRRARGRPICASVTLVPEEEISEQTDA